MTTMVTISGRGLTALAVALLLLSGAAVADDAPRFVDGGNGTVTDTVTGLVWLRRADAFGQLAWADAVKVCAGLEAGAAEGLDDGSRPGDWRLPDVHEMLSLTDLGVSGGALPDVHPFEALPGRSVSRSEFYWTRAAGVYDPGRAWSVRPGRGRAGGMDLVAKSEKRHVWPVRGKPRFQPNPQPHPIPAATWDTLTAKEQVRAERNAVWDFNGLRDRQDFALFQTNDFLSVPKELAAWYPSEQYAVAASAPEVRLRILPRLEPEYFPEGEAYSAGWANWAKVTRGPDDRFFMAASDHRGKGAGINLYEYRHAAGTLERVLDVRKTLGWTADQYTDGKIHGYMDIMPDGNLWAATHRGPKPTAEWYAAGYRGSWLLSYNIHTGEAHNWGVPLIGNSLPYYSLDTQRGIFFGSGENKTLLCWDLNKKQTIFAGYPPNGWDWYEVSVQLHDVKTGIFWGMDISEKPYRFLSFDPALNRFERHDLEIPSNPVTGEQGKFLHNTNVPDADGWYYCFAGGNGGTLFRFRPDGPKGPETETLGVTSGERGAPVHQLVLCPKGRYVYYVPRRREALVVMQYDIRTGVHKALGFLSEPIFQRYGYWTGDGIYGMNVSEDGSYLVILDNGAFAGRGSGFGGHPAVLVVTIPPGERL